MYKRQIETQEVYKNIPNIVWQPQMICLHNLAEHLITVIRRRHLIEMCIRDRSGDNIIQLENQVGNLLPKALYSDVNHLFIHNSIQKMCIRDRLGTV